MITDLVPLFMSRDTPPSSDLYGLNYCSPVYTGFKYALLGPGIEPAITMSPDSIIYEKICLEHSSYNWNTSET